MTTAQREFEQTAASLGASFDRRGAGRLTEGARLRLLLAVDGLAALVAWGALSHVGIEASTDARGATSAQEAPRYDGRLYVGVAQPPPDPPGCRHHAGSLIPAWTPPRGPAPQSTWISQVVR